IGAAFQHHLVYSCMTNQPSCPPERVAAFHMVRNEKDGDGNLQLTCKWKSMCVVIVITIVECQCQECATILPLCSFFVQHVEFFQGRFEMEYAIVTTQVKQMAAQVKEHRGRIVAHTWH